MAGHSHAFRSARARRRGGVVRTVLYAPSQYWMHAYTRELLRESRTFKRAVAETLALWKAGTSTRKKMARIVEQYDLAWLKKKGFIA